MASPTGNPTSNAPRQRSRIVGVAKACAPLVLEEWIVRANIRVNIVLVADQKLAEQFAEDIALFHRAREPESARFESVVFPELRDGDAGDVENFDLACDRLAVIERLRETVNTGARVVIVATPAALMQPAPDSAELEQRALRLATGEHHALAAVVSRLAELDYDAEALCEAPGQYAVRGGIIDVYPITAEQPFRIDFLGDEIEDIRLLDPVTQRSGARAASVTLLPPPKNVGSAPDTSLVSGQIREAVHWLVYEPDEIAAAVSSLARTDDSGERGSRWSEHLAHRSGRDDRWTEFSDLDLGAADDPEPVAIDAEPLSMFRALASETRLADERLIEELAQRARFLEHLNNWAHAGEHIAIVLPRAGEEQRVVELLREDSKLEHLVPEFLVGAINEGFRIRFREGHERPTWPRLRQATGLVVVSETEIFGSRRRRRTGGRVRAQVNQSQVDQLLDFSELVEGEFVVHLQHGIAIYRGASQLELHGQTREVLTLEFDAGVTLHVPLQESHLVSRYVGLTKSRPQLGRIGSGRWEKVRAAAERATLDYAARLLEVQAKRTLSPGFAFSPDTEWQREFEALFPYKETPDQMRTILDVKADMELTESMDRLVCGDVGYGKTEVALRAAFKAVMSGKQVAVLVPTTVLAQQHFNTFRERMSGFPVVVEMISRFRTQSEQARIVKALEEGRVDILIGTHRLIQRDVRFRDLGLVVVDEEQRFGVKHKEVFKDWKTNVDVLSMSATPIPRTLYLALTGARHLSVIETPPADRRPIQTVVKAYDERFVADAIRRELRRGGQVFYLHNRVTTIDLVASRLRELVPEATFGVGHGQMHEKDLERVMVEFVDGRFQVLVCTTIIESGLDIPNCNTLIIEGADRFGLSQLYQLRGRVGRFRHQAYAYLLLHRHGRLLDLARKRLNAIRQHNQLGAGFRIAMRDLELRGAGNLLGAEQSGHIVGVGFELYCQLLRQSISRLKGDPAADFIRASVKLDFVVLGEKQYEDRPESVARRDDGFTAIKDHEHAQHEITALEARIPADYVPELQLRVDFYRRLAMVSTVAEVRQLIDDLEDRFGKPPKQVRALAALTEIRCLAEHKRLISVEAEGNRLKLRRPSSKHDDFIMPGNRFPRLTARAPLARLREIMTFLNNLST